MKKITVSLMVSTCLLILLSIASYPQLYQEDTSRQVLIKLKPNVIEYVRSNQYDIVSTNAPDSLKTLLFNNNVRSLSKAMPEFTPADTNAISASGTRFKRNDWYNLFLVDIPKNINPETFINQINDLSCVEYAESNYISVSVRQGGGEYPVDDARFFRQWNMKNIINTDMDIQAAYAWSSEQGSPNVKVAIVDAFGVNTEHPEFAGRLYGDGISSNNNHGTFIAGILGATGDNSIGIAGVDWESKIYSYDFNRLSVLSICQKLEAAMNAGALVINNSWGMNTWKDTIRSKLFELYDANILLVHASTETGHEVAIPNAFGSFLFQVAGFDIEGISSDFTVENVYTDVAAPGGNLIETPQEEKIYSTMILGGSGGIEDQQSAMASPSNVQAIATSDPEGTYGWWAGTSFAAPHAAGVATLMLAYNATLGRGQTLYNYDLEGIIKLSADNMGPNKKIYGSGRVNAARALAYLDEPYQLTHELATLTQVGPLNQFQFFYSDPFPDDHKRHGWGATFYRVDCYKLTGNHSPIAPYDETPMAWLSMTGYSGVDPAAENYEGVVSNISTSSVSMTTYFWHIDYAIDIMDVWHEVDEWAPYNPFIFTAADRRKLSVLGKQAIPPIQLPSAPSGLAVSYNESKMLYQITWNRSPSEQQVDKYWLKRAFDGGGYVTVSDNISNSGSGSTVTTWDNPTIPPGTEEIWYRVAAHNSSGWGGFCIAVSSSPGGGGPLSAESAEIELVQMPKVLSLDQNYPNPFNPSTQIKFGLPTSSNVRLRVMNIRGETVRGLVDGEMGAGWHTVTWDGKNEGGNQVASGIYLYLIEADGKRILKRMTYIK